MSFEIAVQSAIYTALTGDTGLMALIEGVYDSVPETEVFPYVTIGEDSHASYTTNTTLGTDVSCVIHTWSRDRGKKETKTIQGEIYDALNRASLTYAGHKIVNCELESSDSFVDADRLTRHGVQSFRVLIERV